LIPMVKAVMAVKPPSYQTVLELDRKIRSFTQPRLDAHSGERTATSMGTFVRAHYQDLSEFIASVAINQHPPIY
jgi:hypothetical protein